MKTVHNKTRQVTKSEVLRLRAKTTTDGKVGTLKLSVVKDEAGRLTQWGWKGYLVLAQDLTVIAKVSWGKQARGLVRLIDNQYHSERGALWETVKTGSIRIVDDSLLSDEMKAEIAEYIDGKVKILKAGEVKGRVRKVKRW